MLVLTRKRTETIKIGQDIIITVIETSKGTVKLGIQAPANIRVLRAELDKSPTSPIKVDSAPAKPALRMVNATVVTSHSDDEPELPMFSAERFLNEFDSDYLAEVEDQSLLCLAE